MIKAQVKSLIELSFRLISLLPLAAKALNPPPCALRGGMSLLAQPCLIQDDGTTQLQYQHILTRHMLFSINTENERVLKLTILFYA